MLCISHLPPWRNRFMQTITSAVSGGWPLDATGHHAEAVDDRFLVLHARNLELNLVQRADHLLDAPGVVRFRRLGDLALEFHPLTLQRAGPFI